MLTSDEIEFVLHGEWQDVRESPCNECPWRRASIEGFTGPFEAEDWLNQAHADGPIHCHKTIKKGMAMDDPELLQCAGAARFRAHVCKNPRNPTAAVGPNDREKVFTSNREFADHHGE